MKLTKYYQIATLVPAGMMLIGLMTWLMIMFYDRSGESNKWINNYDIFSYAVIYVFSFVFAACLLSLPIYLNKFAWVRCRNFLRELSWFLLPGFWMAYILFSYQVGVGHNTNKNRVYEELIFLCFFSASYGLGLLLSYKSFCRDLHKQNAPATSDRSVSV